MSVQQTPHSVENYTIPKGVLYIGEWSGTTPPTNPTGYSDIGNCSSINVEVKVDNLPHFETDSTDLVRRKTDNHIVQYEYFVNFDLDEIAAVNLERYLVGGLTGSVVKALTDLTKKYALKFVSNNIVGPNVTWNFWKCSLIPNGAFQLVGVEWAVLSYIAEGLSDDANHSTSPYFNASYSSSSSSLSSSSSASS